LFGLSGLKTDTRNSAVFQKIARPHTAGRAIPPSRDY
jgi:hypothetical protein